MENLQKKIQFVLNLCKSKNFSKAESLTRELIDYSPKTIILYNLLGLILTYQKKIDQALSCYKKGLKIKHDDGMLHNNIGTIYKSKREYDKAESYYKKSIELDKNIPESQNNLANLYLFLNKHDKAIGHFKKAIEINPKFLIAHFNLGVFYKSIGKFNVAINHLKIAIQLNKNFFAAHRALSQIIKFDLNNENFNMLKEIYNDEKIKKNEKIEVIFSLGKAFEDFKEYKKAFEYYDEANNLRRKNISFSIKKEKKEFIDIKKIFNNNIFNKFKGFGNVENKAIFILGMPRSGTTLVEQILSNHPKVYGGDELNFIPDLIKDNFVNENNQYDLKKINFFTEKTLKKIAKDYLTKLNNLSNKHEKVTDKLPINFKWIGLIKLILPNSKIVHCTRNSRDICFSIFKNYFINPQLNFACNLEDIVYFYNLYNDLMKYWKKTLPEFIYELNYEKIINNPESEIRGLIKFCDLDWNSKCLEFYNNKRVIKTSSDTQVRRKIYKTSINSWKNYEDNLKDKFRKLSN